MAFRKLERWMVDYDVFVVEPRSLLDLRRFLEQVEKRPCDEEDHTVPGCLACEAGELLRELS